MRQPLETGQLLASTYRILEPLSHGAFGTLFTAERVGDRLPVVVKALREDASRADPSAVQRFVREAAVAAMLEHPNIVRTLNFGKTRDGVLYIVLERLFGKTLGEAMFEHAVAPEIVAEVLRQMLDGLAYAHAMGVVHRDLKPSNVFVCEPDHRGAGGEREGDLVKLLDFGFVKVLNDQHGAAFSAQLTMRGAVVGTPGYIAPELMIPNAPVVTPGADLYAVGVLAYELLSANKAFPGEGLARAMRQLDSDPEPLPRALRGLPIVPVLERLMARDPDHRYRSAEAALADVLALPRL